MSKMNNLDSILSEMLRNAKSIMELADALEKEFSSGATESQKKDSKKKTPLTTTQKSDEETVSAKEISLAEIKAVLMEKSRAGFDAEVHSLIQGYDAPKLSAIDKAHYPELLEKAREIGNA